MQFAINFLEAQPLLDLDMSVICMKLIVNSYWSGTILIEYSHTSLK